MKYSKTEHQRPQLQLQLSLHLMVALLLFIFARSSDIVHAFATPGKVHVHPSNMPSNQIISASTMVKSKSNDSTRKDDGNTDIDPVVLDQKVDDKAGVDVFPRFQDEGAESQLAVAGGRGRNGIVTSLPWARFGAMLGVATKTSTQNLMHASFGVGSIVIGVLNLSKAFVLGFGTPISQRSVLIQGFVHITTAIIGTAKLSWSEKDSTRDFIIASIASVNAVVFYIALSNVVQEANALFMISKKMASSIMLTFTCWFTWQLKKVWNEQPNQEGRTLWVGTRTQNTLGVAFAYHLATLPIVGLLLAPVLSGIPGGIFTSFLSSYPDFTFILRNICVSIMFSNNLAAFLATLFKYKVFSDPRVIFAVMIVPVNTFVAIPILMSFFTAANGYMGYEWVRMLTLWIDPTIFDF